MNFEKNNLKLLFYYKNSNMKRAKKLKKPVSYVKFKNIIFNSINLINKKSSNSFINEKYKLYVNNFENLKPNAKSLGFHHINTHIEYFISRGWNKDESKLLLKERQNTCSKEKFIKKFGEINGLLEFEKYELKRLKTHKENFKKGKHKKFFRPSQIGYWVKKGYNKDEAIIQIKKYYREKGLNFHKRLREQGIEFLTCRQVKYWIKNGYSYQEAINQIKKICDTR